MATSRLISTTSIMRSQLTYVYLRALSILLTYIPHLPTDTLNPISPCSPCLPIPHLPTHYSEDIRRKPSFSNRAVCNFSKTTMVCSAYSTDNNLSFNKSLSNFLNHYQAKRLLIKQGFIWRLLNLVSSPTA